MFNLTTTTISFTPDTPKFSTTSIAVALSIVFGIPALFISGCVLHLCLRAPVTPHTDTNTNTNTANSNSLSNNLTTSNLPNGPIIPSDASNMAILGREITPTSTSTSSHSSHTHSSQDSGGVDPEAGIANPPPPYVEVWEDADLDEGVGIEGRYGEGEDGIQMGAWRDGFAIVGVRVRDSGDVAGGGEGEGDEERPPEYQMPLPPEYHHG